MLFAELKKIWRPGVVLLVLLVSVLFFFSFLYQWIKPFTWENDSFNTEIGILSDWITEYGNYIDDEEFNQIVENYNSILSQAASVIGEDSYFEENGIKDYEEYLQYAQNAINGYEGYNYNVYTDMRSLILQNTGYSSIYLQEYESIMQHYKDAGNGSSSVLPHTVMRYTNNYLVYLTILCLVCAFFMSAIVMVSDQSSNVVAAQYSSKRGKKIYQMQYFAMVGSSILIVSIIVTIGLSAWKSTGVMVFADSDLKSFLNTQNPVIDLTYGKYIALFVAMIYLLAIGMSSIIFCLSAHSSNMIAMLLKTIPVLVVGCIVALLLQDVFFEENVIYHLLKIKYGEVLVVLIFFVTGIFLNMVNYKFLKRRDCL